MCSGESEEVGRAVRPREDLMRIIINYKSFGQPLSVGTESRASAGCGVVCYSDDSSIRSMDRT